LMPHREQPIEYLFEIRCEQDTYSGRLTAGVHLARFAAQCYRTRADGVGHLRRDLIPREPATQGHRDPDCARSGSGRATVVRWVAGQSGRLIGIGTAVGLVRAMAVSQLMSSRTPMVDPQEPVAYATGWAIVAGAALLVCIAPAVRDQDSVSSAVVRIRRAVKDCM